MNRIRGNNKRDETFKRILNEWNSGGLRSQDERKEFGKTFLPPLSTKSVSNYIGDLRNEGKIPKVWKVKYQIWTEEEDNLLKEKSKLFTLEEVQKRFFPNRTKDGIQHRSVKLGLNLHQYKTNPYTKHWTKEEIKILKHFGGELNYSVTEISEMLTDRTKISIYDKMRKMGMDILRLKDDEYVNVPWKDWEIEILKKWYSIIGVGDSEGGKFIGKPNLSDMLPHRSHNSLRVKCWKMNLVYNPQNGVKVGHKRCLLCLEIKSEKMFSKWMKGDYPYCKICDKKVRKYHETKTEERRLGTSLKKRYISKTGNPISIQECMDVVYRVKERVGYKCYFEDEFCDNRGRMGLTLGHIQPTSRGGKFVDDKNIVFLCMEHNGFISDMNFNELKKGLLSMYNTLSND
jgi:hypothetical protein